MAKPAGESSGEVLRLDFGRRSTLQFRGSVVTSDAGLLAYRELDDALGPSAMAGEKLADARQGRMASGRTLSACPLHHDKHGAPRRKRRRLLQQVWHLRTMDQRGQGRDQMDAPFMPFVRRQRRPSSASRARLQSRQLPAHAGDARADQRLVADEPEGKVDQGRRSSAAAAMSPSRWPRSPFREICSPNSMADRRTAADARHINGVRLLVVTRSIKNHGRRSS